MKNILSVEKIEKYYGNKGNITKAIDNISFKVGEGEFVGIMGPSGSGKTTLLNCISTIDKVTTGNIIINDQDITRLKSKKLDKFRQNELGFIFQDFNLLDTLTAYENIALALTIKGEKTSEIDSKIKELRENNQLEDITILTTNENTGVDIVKFFMNKGIKVSHVYDINKKKNEKNRRNEKWKFRGGTGRLKVCSYHSYKGWQTPNIILVLDSYGRENIVDIRKNVGNAIFISMSRVKPNSMNGQFSFTCFNYLPEYNFLEKLF